MNSRAKTLMFFSVAIVLWVRQLRFERHLWERGATRGITGIFQRQVGEIEGIFKRWHRQIDEALL